ncbi:MAG: hypothetical protein WBC93_06845 [Sulfitobacter sp.]
MKPLFCVVFASLFAAFPAFAEMKAQVLPPWNGKTVPAGQQCTLDGGNGKTPPFQVTGIPEGTAAIYVEYNDRDFSKLSSKGGHGIIAYGVKGPSAKFPALPGLTAKLPGGAQVVKKARSTGNYASAGYLPPCSGGKGHRYQAQVKAISAAGKVLAKTRMDLGRY